MTVARAAARLSQMLQPVLPCVAPVERAQRLADLAPGATEKKMEIDQSATEEGRSSV